MAGAGTICRTCAMESLNMTAIYGPEGKNQRLDEKINTYLPITIHEGDTLPLNMCFTCVSRLEACHQIIVSCLSADEYFQKTEGEVKLGDENESNALMVSTEQYLEQENKRNISELSINTFQHPKIDKESQDLQPLESLPSPLEVSAHEESTTNSPQLISPTISGLTTPEYIFPAASDSLPNLKAVKPEKITPQKSKRCLAKTTRQSEAKIKDRPKRSKGTKQEDNVAKEEKKERKTVSCKECGETFTKKHLYLAHIRQHRIEKEVLIHTCKDCDEKFRTAFLLAQHRKSHPPSSKNRPTHPCTLCTKVFKTKAHLRQHTASHSSEKPYHCHLCPKKFKLQYEFTHHIKYHSTIKGKICPECNKVISSSEAYKRHMHRHSQGITVIGDEPIECPICHEQFKQHRGMEIHVYWKHPTSPLVSQLGLKLREKKFTCSYCDSKFTSRASLRSHINSHTKEKTYACNVCSRPFYSPVVLKQHMLSKHSDERPFPCMYCTKRFKRRADLHLHNRTHTGEKPYACDICNQSFSQRGDMRKHRERHNKEGTRKQPLQCMGCGENFARKNDSIAHRCPAEQDQDVADILMAFVH